MNDVQKILLNTFQNSNWTITKPVYGLSKEKFIARNENKTVFIKFNINVLALQRVSDLGLTPKILSSGKLNNTSYVIQEFIEGIHPNRMWFNSNFVRLANFINKYHSDAQLFSMLKEKSSTSYQQNIVDGIRYLDQQLALCKNLILRDNQIKDAVAKLMNTASELEAVQLTPIHTDPNSKNILLAEDKLYMLDWDDVRISDPVRDIAPLLWWYVEKDKWPLFFDEMHMAMNDSLIKRFYWWVARQSLTIAIFFAKRNDLEEMNRYLTDFIAAQNHKDNPQYL